MQNERRFHIFDFVVDGVYIGGGSVPFVAEREVVMTDEQGSGVALPTPAEIDRMYERMFEAEDRRFSERLASEVPAHELEFGKRRREEG